MEEIPIQNTSLDCSPAVHLMLGKYRDTARATTRNRRKYTFTDQIDQLVREIYLNAPDAKTRPGIRLLAKKIGMPHRALKKRARELGLTRTKEMHWSEPELEILARYAWMSDERIRLKLKAAGYPYCNRDSPQVETNALQARRELLFLQRSRASTGN